MPHPKHEHQGRSLRCLCKGVGEIWNHGLLTIQSGLMKKNIIKMASKRVGKKTVPTTQVAVKITPIRKRIHHV